MKGKIRLYYLLYCLAALAPLSALPPQVDKGILDFRSRDLSGIFPLTGEWEFRSESGNAMYLNVPGRWENKTGYNLGGGFYSLTILNDDHAEGQAALLLTRLWQDIRVFIDGELVFDSFGTDDDFLRFTRSVIPVPREREVKIVIQMENRYFRNGGMHHALLYGSHSQIIRYKYLNLMKESAISGVLFLLFLYNLFLFINHYALRSSLYLSIVSLLYSLRNLFSGEVLIEMLLPRNLLITGTLRWNHVFLYLGSAFILLFIWTIFSFSESGLKKVLLGLFSAGLMLALFTMFIPMELVSRCIAVVQGYGLAAFLYSFFLIFLRVKKRNLDGIIIFAGALVFFSLVLVDIYLVHRGVLLRELTQAGLLVFILSDFFVLTRRFGKSYLQAERLSRELEQEVSRQTRELKQLSRTDPLTGINNRRRFFELGNREMGIHRRKGRELSLLMLDLDHFKRVNDEYGHSIGDKALVFMTGLCLEEVRESDIFGRLGGEEFALILLETGLDRAAETAERIRKRLEESSRDRRDGIPPMTVSIGAVCFGEGESLDEGLERADDLLYEAKERGRNRVVAREY